MTCLIHVRSMFIYRFFLRLYYLVISYVLVVSLSMIPLYYLGLLLSYYYVVITIYAPVGPLPLGLLPSYFFPYLNTVIQGLLRSSDGTIIATIIVSVLLTSKILILHLSRNRHIFRTRLVYLELAILVVGLGELIMYYFTEHYVLKTTVKTLILYTYWLIGSTLPADITFLSYTFYRDTITQTGRTSTKHLLAAPLLWLTTLWLSILPNPEILLKALLQPQHNIPSTIMFTIWIIITITEPFTTHKNIKKQK